MSDSWRSRSQSIFDPFEEEGENEYRPWRTGQQGSAMNLKLVPHTGSGEPVRYIPYLQPITIELHAQTHQLCLLCHSSQMVVFIEGTGLAELAEQISEKRVRSIHEIEPDLPNAIGKEYRPIVTKITIGTNKNSGK